MRMSTVFAMLVGIGVAGALAQEVAEVRQPAAQGKAKTEVQTVRGVVSCEWQVVGRYECRRRAPQDCARECVSMGSAYVLVADKNMYWLSGNARELDQVAGGAAVVNGTVEGRTLSVLSIIEVPKHLSLRFWK
jgi:hypothetical protein